MYTRRTYIADYRIGYRRHNRLRIFKFLFWGLILVMVGFFIIKMSDIFVKPMSISKNVISPLAKDFKINTVEGVSSTLNNVKLSQIVEAYTQSEKGTYAVGVLNLKTGEEYFKNKHGKFESASLYKLWVMGLTYQKIENGDLTLDKTLSQDIAILNSRFNISEEDAERTEGTITETVNEALTKMITVSDNYSALLLSSYLGISKLNTYVHQINLSDSETGGADTLPKTSVYDSVYFLYKLYNGELGNEESTKEMLNLLKKQTLNGKLPKYLPESLVIAHKTGELGTVSHDVGIVYSEKGPYIIAVLTDTPNPANANNVIAEISKAVFDYFETK